MDILKSKKQEAYKKQLCMSTAEVSATIERK